MVTSRATFLIEGCTKEQVLQLQAKKHTWARVCVGGSNVARIPTVKHQETIHLRDRGGEPEQRCQANQEHCDCGCCQLLSSLSHDCEEYDKIEH
jgi:hypothetical protein